jgi:hypothetical protein
MLRGAGGEARRQSAEEFVDFALAVRVAPGTEDAYGLVARLERPPRGRVAVVQGKLGVVQLGFDPDQEVIAVAHAGEVPPFNAFESR